MRLLLRRCTEGDTKNDCDGRADSSTSSRGTATADGKNQHRHCRTGTVVYSGDLLRVWLRQERPDEAL
jgi:hypothetical protein